MLFHLAVLSVAVLLAIHRAAALPIDKDQADAALDTAKRVIDDVKLSLAETDRCTAIAVGKCKPILT